MKDLITIAVEKAIGEKAFKAASKDLEPGRYEIDALVRIVGELSKSADTTMRPTVKVKWQLLAAVALSKVNKETRAAVLDAFVEAMADENALVELQDEIKKGVEAKLEKLADKLEPIPVTGKITAKIVAEEVSVTKADKLP